MLLYKDCPKGKQEERHYDPQIYRKIRLPIDFNTEIEYLKNILNYCLTRLDTLDEITPENPVPSRCTFLQMRHPLHHKLLQKQKMKPQSRILSPSYNVQLQMMMKWVGERKSPSRAARFSTNTVEGSASSAQGGRNRAALNRQPSQSHLAQLKQ